MNMGRLFRLRSGELLRKYLVAPETVANELRRSMLSRIAVELDRSRQLRCRPRAIGEANSHVDGPNREP